MRHYVHLRVFILAALAIAVCTAAQSAELDKMMFEKYKIDAAKVQKAVTKNVSKHNRVPVGIVTEKNMIHFLYLDNSIVGARAWSLEEYKDLRDMKAAASKKAQEGYSIFDINFTGGGILQALYLAAGKPSGDIAIAMGNNVGELEKSIAKYAGDGYYPAGIAEKDGVTYAVVVRSESGRGAWKLAAYEKPYKELVPDLQKNFAAGLYPFSLHKYADEKIALVYHEWKASGAQAATAKTPEAAPAPSESGAGSEGGSVWKGAGGQTVRIDTKAGIIETTNGSVRVVFKITASSGGEYSAKVSGMNVSPPQDYPEALAEADARAAENGVSKLGEKVFKFKVEKKGGSKIALTTTWPGGGAYGEAETFVGAEKE